MQWSVHEAKREVQYLWPQ